MKYCSACFIIFLGLAFTGSILAQPSVSRDNPAPPDAPKLIVGIIVDQMRYDLLYRYQEKYGAGGFRRLLSEGYNCRNTHYNYTPTFTGPGHASVYTGTTPSTHGIIANNWYSREFNKNLYVTEDPTRSTVGSNSSAGKMSPVHLLSTTITDELRLHTNKRSKVIGIALKDRGSILPAGHMPNAAYWFDRSNGRWITSTFYMPALPEWVVRFNRDSLADRYLGQPWLPLLQDISLYTESTGDNQPFEYGFLDGSAPVFPHDLPFYFKNWKYPEARYELLLKTPFGNSLTTDFAIKAIEAEQLGKGQFTDFLALSYSSTDYVGHQFGIRSVEVEDTYLRLDKELERLLIFLDGYAGKDNVMIFLTADHGVAENPVFLQSNHIPAGYFVEHDIMERLEDYFDQKYDSTFEWIDTVMNQQVYLKKDINEAVREMLEKETVAFLLDIKGVKTAFPNADLPAINSNDPQIRLFQNGLYRGRSGDVVFIMAPGWFDTENTAATKGTTHGSGYSYDTHVPLVWYGWKIRPGSSAVPVSITDIAPTIADMLRILEPSGCTGQVIQGIVRE